MKLPKKLAALILSVFSSWAGPTKKDQQELVAAVIWAEAHGEGSLGMLAVAEVIRNRTLQPKRFGATAYDVVKQPHQFACLNRVTPRELIARASQDTHNWGFCITLVEEVIDGNYHTFAVYGATHFHSDYATPAWRNELEYTARIGGHHFYK